jgi:hypothetical protein
MFFFHSIRSFTALMRTYKIGTILLYQADARDKREDSESALDTDDEGCTRQKCRVWFHLSQELTTICCVAFLLIVCLPVLAFWFMFISILVSSGNIFMLMRRLWKDSHNEDASRLGRSDGPYGEEDIEFEEFVSNFVKGNDV